MGQCYNMIPKKKWSASDAQAQERALGFDPKNMTVNKDVNVERRKK